MLVFFIVLGVFILINIIIFFSSIKVEIDTLKIDNKEKLRVNDFKIKFYLVLGKKIKWAKMEITKEKLGNMNKANLDKLLTKITNLKIFKDLKNTGFIKKRGIISKAIKDSNLQLERLDLKADIGLSSIIALSYLVAIIDIIISINLAKRANNLNYNNFKYTITPHQTKKFNLKLSINCIISVKIANIISTIIKKRSEDKNVRTSNRIINGNSHEQYPRYDRCRYNYR